MEHYLEALTLAQKIEDNDLIAEANQNIGNVYSWAKEYKVSNYYFNKVKDYVQTIKDDLWLAGTLLGIGGNFEKLNILDSARHYIQQANELSLKLNFSPLRISVLVILGDIHSKMGLDKLALEYYRLSLNESRTNNNLDGISMVANSMAQLYQLKGLKDSSFFYAKLAIDTDAKLNRQAALSSLALLVNFYKDHMQIDSAFLYHQKWAVVKDSLFGEEQTKQLQTLSFHESVREKQKAEENLKREKERVNNLQVMAIGTFIITCFILLFLVSKRNTKPKTIEIFGGIALLLAFEFLALLLHPFIERITHHTPILVFLCLVAIASVLVPLHYKLEKMVKEKLAQKPVLTPTIEQTTDLPPAEAGV